MAKLHKEIFLTRLLMERDKFELLLNRVGYTRRMTLKGIAGRYSIKDMLAYIWAYEQYLADRMNEIANGHAYTPCKTKSALDAFLDEFGYPDFGSPLLDEEYPIEWIIEKYRNVSLDDLVAQEIEAFAAIVSTLKSMNETVINRHNLYNRIIKHTYEHYHKHVHEIRHWLRVNGIHIT